MSKYQEALDRVLNHVNLKVVINDEHGLPKILRDNQGYQDLELIQELIDKETQDYYLKRVDDLEQIKSLETNQLLLAIDITGKKHIINKWYINSKQELIYSDDKDRINLKMYFGIIEANSYIRDLYIL